MWLFGRTLGVCHGAVGVVSRGCGCVCHGQWVWLSDVLGVMLSANVPVTRGLCFMIECELLAECDGFR